MREKLYHLLVNRRPEIRERYFRKRPCLTSKAAGLAYLVLLNLRYGLLPSRRSLLLPDTALRLYRKTSESVLSARETPEQLAALLAEYEIISFDIFDTLLFRPFTDPTVLFDLVGGELGYLNFRRLRISAEEQARREKQERTGSREVTLGEIWTVVARETGIERETGMQTEWEWERRCCYANPYMLRAVNALSRMGKQIIAVSDMYLSGRQLERLLSENGYPPVSGCFSSGELGCSKSDGSLYDALRRRYGAERRIVHVGDNRHSDVKNASSHGLRSVWYPNVNHTGAPFRPKDLSFLTGSIYGGLVNSQIHCGLGPYSPEYEYGFLYGGLFVTGYCRFIHDYCHSQGVDRLLFLSRDGYLLHKAYLELYPDETDRTAYTYWSRLAAVKVTADHYKSEYFDRFLFHRVGERLSLRRIIEDMELPLLRSLCRERGLDPESVFTYKTARIVKDYLTEHWQQVSAAYGPQRKAAGSYYTALLAGCGRAAAVDIGWAGSSVAMLECAVSRIWRLPCRVTGIVAGTLPANSPSPDAAAGLLWSGRLTSYLFSDADNRDLWRFHDPAKGHNLYWELLLGAPEGGLIGFYPEPDGEGIEPRLKQGPAQPERIREIHRGALDFVRLFMKTERKLGLTIPVSGRDAYAPMVAFLGRYNHPLRKKLERLLDEPGIL